MSDSATFRGNDPDVPTEVASAPSEKEAVFVLMLHESLYSLPSILVDQVAPVAPYVRVPGAPTHILGVVQLREQILAVIDAHTLLGLRSASPGERDTQARLVALTIDRIPFAVLVDAVLGVQEVEVASMHRSVNPANQTPSDLVEGRFELPAGIVTMLSPKALLTAVVAH